MIKVIDHEPQAWYLLKRENDYFLDINYSQSFVSFSLLTKLKPKERAIYLTKGRDFIVEMEREIMSKGYKKIRNRVIPHNKTAPFHEAIMAWRKIKNLS